MERVQTCEAQVTKVTGSHLSSSVESSPPAQTLNPPSPVPSMPSSCGLRDLSVWGTKASFGYASHIGWSGSTPPPPQAGRFHGPGYQLGTACTL